MKALMKSSGYPWAKLSLLVLVLLIIFIFNLTWGSVSIPLSAIKNMLLGHTPEKLSWLAIFWEFRFPKNLAALLAGIALSVSGLQMQTLFRNPLADPFVLGISSGASLGVSLVLLTIPTSWLGNMVGGLGIQFAAMLGSAIVMAIILWAAKRLEGNLPLLLLGIMLGYAVGALVNVLLASAQAAQVQSYALWNFGTFAGVSWQRLPLMASLILMGILFSFFAMKAMNALLLGDQYARSLGVSLRQSRWILLFSTCLLTGAVTAYCGPLAFLGLAVPHAARYLFRTADHRILLPVCILLGGIVAIGADALTQLPGSGHILPLNTILSLLGAPIVILLLLRRRGGF